MNVTGSSFDQWLVTRLTRSRVTFLCGGYLLLQTLIFLYAVTVPGMEDRLGFVRGRDLLQFFISGRIVARGESQHLYDHEFFTQTQYELHPLTDANRDQNPPYFSLYPPTLALAVSLPARLPYDLFVVLGWLWTVGGYVFVARWIIHDLDPAAEWRLASWLGILGFHSAIVMLWNCQFSWLWTMGFLACFRWRRSGHDFTAGLCLSLLTLKPQFAAAAVLWLLLRPAWRTLAGLLVGFMSQAAVVAIVLGPSIWRDYFVGASIYSRLSSLYQFDPEYQQAILGIIQGWLGGEQIWLCRGLALLVAAFAGWGAFRIFRSPTTNHRMEESAVILLVLLVIPHLLIYDLTLLLIPMVHVLALHRERDDEVPAWPAALLYGLTMLAPLYRTVPGFSLVPLAMLTTLVILMRVKQPGGLTASSELT